MKALVVPLRGRVFKDVNRELRIVSKKIATEIRPDVVAGVRSSRAPQAWPLSATVRVKSDRVPVLSVGAVNPRFASGQFSRRGSGDSKRRRGALAHGVVYGTKGGKRHGGGDYYHIGRDETGGPLGKTLRNGRAMKRAQAAYKREYLKVLRRYGFDVGRVL